MVPQRLASFSRSAGPEAFEMEVDERIVGGGMRDVSFSSSQVWNHYALASVFLLLRGKHVLTMKVALVQGSHNVFDLVCMVTSMVADVIKRSNEYIHHLRKSGQGYLGAHPGDTTLVRPWRQAVLEL